MIAANEGCINSPSAGAELPAPADRGLALLALGR